MGLAGSVFFKTFNRKKTEKSMIKSIKPMGFTWETIDPFIFCVHHEDAYPKANSEQGPDAPLKGRNIGDDFVVRDGWRMYHGKRVPGFPVHPHRGFETVTVVRKGFVDHSDSLGAAGRYGDGDIQWMTAGKGIQHSEMFPLLDQEKENPLELFQIWLNLPSFNKMVKPHFKMIWGKQVPVHKTTDAIGKKTMTEIIAGKIFGHQAVSPPPDSWAADLENEIMILNIYMDQGAEITIPKASGGIRRMIYFYEGDTIAIGEAEIKKYHSAEVNAQSDLSILAKGADARILMLQGRPINEPVVQYGPFVMNTREEIQQAFRDYNATSFGGWPWDRNDPVHGHEKKRFARYIDGSFQEGM
jgi:redox-sensitive bicupin YhaK (pirin superfamily)